FCSSGLGFGAGLCCPPPFAMGCSFRSNRVTHLHYRNVNAVAVFYPFSDTLVNAFFSLINHLGGCPCRTCCTASARKYEWSARAKVFHKRNSLISRVSIARM